MDPCVFCMIGRGELKARVVYEDDEFIAFDDIMPQGPVHTLVIPRAHHAGLTDDVPRDVLGGLLETVGKVAEAKGIAASGYRVIVNNGRDAGQVVHHLHAHVLGGGPMTHLLIRYDDDARP